MAATSMAKQVAAAVGRGAPVEVGDQDRQRAQLNKQRVLLCLTRLNDKATQRSAAEDLSAIVNALDADSALVLINNICTSNAAWEPKAFARRECIRALGHMASEACPVRELLLLQYLGKALAHLKRHMQEADVAVRDACVETLGAIAAASCELHDGAPLPGSSSHPVVRLVFECLADPKREAQAAAGQALLQVSDMLGSLDREYVKLVLRCLKNPGFQAPAQLLAALGSTHPDSLQPMGLLKGAAGTSFLPYIAHLIGQPAQPGAPAGAGILGCLGSRDWAVRRAAADALRVAAAVLGPRMEPEGCWQQGHASSLTSRCLACLEAAKFDKVKEAREVARDALQAMEQLQLTHTSLPGGEAPATPGAPDLPRPPSSAGGAPCSRSPPGRGALASGVSEVFRRSAARRDLVVDVAPRPKSAIVLSHSTAPVATATRRPSVVLARQGNDALIPADWGELAHAGQPARTGSDDGALHGALDVGTRPASATAAGSGGAAPDASARAVEGIAVPEHAQRIAPAQPLQLPAACSTSPAACSSVRAPGEEAALPSAPPSAQEWNDVRSALQCLQQQQAGMAALLRQMADSSANALGVLQERVSALEAQLLEQRGHQAPGLPADQPQAPGTEAAPGVSGGALPPATLDAAGAASVTRSADWSTPAHRAGQPSGLRLACTPASAESLWSPGSPPVDLEAAFVEALQRSRGEMHLLRLIQRTGPVWGALSPATGLALLQVFIKRVQEGVMLHRILPWLWRLADEDLRTLEVPPPTRTALLHALDTCSAAEDLQVHEKVSLLHTTLANIWGLHNGCGPQLAATERHG